MSVGRLSTAAAMRKLSIDVLSDESKCEEMIDRQLLNETEV